MYKAESEREGKESNISTQPIFTWIHRQSPGLGLTFSMAKEKTWVLQNDLSWKKLLQVTQSKPHSVTPGSHQVLTEPTVTDVNLATSQGRWCSLWPPSEQEFLSIYFLVVVVSNFLVSTQNSLVAFCHFNATSYTLANGVKDKVSLFFARRECCGLRFNLSTSLCMAFSDFPARQSSTWCRGLFPRGHGTPQWPLLNFRMLLSAISPAPPGISGALTTPPSLISSTDLPKLHSIL